MVAVLLDLFVLFVVVQLFLDLAPLASRCGSRGAISASFWLATRLEGRLTESRAESSRPNPNALSQTHTRPHSLIAMSTLQVSNSRTARIRQMKTDGHSDSE